MTTPEYPMNTEAKRARAAMERADRQKQDAEQRRAVNFLHTVAANIDNMKLDDEAFREFMRDSMTDMPGVNYTKHIRGGIMG